MPVDPDKNSRKLVIFGAWFYSRVVAEAAQMAGWPVLGFVDPDPPPGMETLDRVPDDASVIVAIGSNQVRSYVHRSLVVHGREFASILHPSACVSPSARLGPGCYIAENAVVRSNSIVGTGTLVNSGAVVSHDCRIGECVTFGPNAATGGHVSVGDRTLIGVGASIRPHARIGSDCTVGAGAAVVRDVDDGSTVVGNPARKTGTNPGAIKQSDWENNPVW